MKSEVDEDLLQEHLQKNLHGSGWDCTWFVTKQKNGLIKCYMDYHVMDEHGFYDGFIGVAAKVSNELEIMSLTFSADSTRRRKFIIGQEDYYFDSISHALSTFGS